MTATGFDLGTLLNSDVLIRFFSDDGKTVNTQIMTRGCLAKLPIAVHALFLAVEMGKDEALKFLNSMTTKEGN